jgi:hypothetical protein
MDATEFRHDERPRAPYPDHSALPDRPDVARHHGDDVVESPIGAGPLDRDRPPLRNAAVTRRGAPRRTGRKNGRTHGWISFRSRITRSTCALKSGNFRLPPEPGDDENSLQIGRFVRSPGSRLPLLAQATPGAGLGCCPEPTQTRGRLPPQQRGREEAEGLKPRSVERQLAGRAAGLALPGALGASSPASLASRSLPAHKTAPPGHPPRPHRQPSQRFARRRHTPARAPFGARPSPRRVSNILRHRIAARRAERTAAGPR